MRTNLAAVADAVSALTPPVVATPRLVKRLPRGDVAWQNGHSAGYYRALTDVLQIIDPTLMEGTY